MAVTKLSKNFDTGKFSIQASFLKQLLWYYTDVFFFKSKLIPFSSVLVGMLRIFGAQIGQEVRIKPGIHIKYPWKLIVGDNSWLADCYIENLDSVTIGKNCCISQRALLMTGNHNYKKVNFDLITAPITLDDGVWIGADSKVCPGVVLKNHSILTMGSLANRDLEAYGIYQGNPAKLIKHRIISD